MAGSNGKEVVVVKKKSSHHGHHGGAWKVAYADFVTAMMALFIVLWMMNTSREIQEAVAGYFRDPKGFKEKLGSGLAGSGSGLIVTKQDMNSLKEKLQAELQKLPEFDELKNHVAITVTGEGLRIELLESETGIFFETGSPEPTQRGRELIELLAKQLQAIPNAIVIEGHTDARPFRTANGYTNWELSVDRANVARKILEGAGLDPRRVVEVRGFADRRLRKPEQPYDASNRRISLTVLYQAPEVGQSEASVRAALAQVAQEAKGAEAQAQGHAGAH